MTMGKMANIGKSLLRGGERVGSSRAGLAAIGIGAFGLGVANKAAPAARDAAFDVAFNDPNADEKFVGRKLNTRFLLGEAMGGVAGTAMRVSSPDDYAAVNAPIVMPTPQNMVATAAASAGLGVGGAIAGAKKGSGVKGKAMGALIGGAIGAALPPAIGASATIAGVRGRMRRNERFYSESPYAGTGGSLATANALSASGDIVLGMHNARRGY